MKGNLAGLILHLEKFVQRQDTSVKWAKEAETMLDEIGVIDDALVEVQDYLSFYRPEGGEHLYDEKQMDQFCRRIIPILRAKLDEKDR